MHDAYARDDAESAPKVTDCRVPYSFFFHLIAKEWHGNNSDPLHRICTLMRKMGVQSFVREVLEPNQEIKDETEAAVVRTGRPVNSKAVRVTFFRTLPESRDWRDIPKGDILGYAVILTLELELEKRCYIFESVVKEPTFWAEDGRTSGIMNYYVHCSRSFTTRIGTANGSEEFSLRGAYFCQQNDLTHVCAHAVLRMALNTWDEYKGGKITVKKINSTLGIDHFPGEAGGVKRYVGKYGPDQTKSTGLTNPLLTRFIKAVGLKPRLADFVENPGVDYEDFIYPFVESGFPTILGLAGFRTAHVVAVLGHTLNTDRWTPEARHGYGMFPLSSYLTTSSWADHFIVSDDNFGMYSTMPTDAVRNVLLPKHNPNLHACLAIGIVPSQVEITGFEAEQFAAPLAQRLIRVTMPTPENSWLHYLKKHRMVCRTLMQKKDGYLANLRTVTDHAGGKLSDAELTAVGELLPELFWVTEITVPNLYTGNRRKLGDFVTKTDVTKEQFKKGDGFCFGWLPGASWHATGTPPPARRGWTLFGHVPLLRGASGYRPLEW